MRASLLTGHWSNWLIIKGHQYLMGHNLVFGPNELGRLLKHRRNFGRRIMLKSILFVCVQNAARSQMAEGFGHKYLSSSINGSVTIQSAGSAPRGKVHPAAVEVMKEVGIDITNQYSKSISEIDLKTVDLVIALCAEEQCPVLPAHVQKLNWSLPDPGSDLETFRDIRDEIERRVIALGNYLKKS